MALYEPNRTGKNTVEYRVVKENYSDLVRYIQYNLLEAAAEFFSCSLIPSGAVQNANNHSVELYSRATSLIMVVLSCIEHDAKKFVTLTSILQKLGLSEIASRLTSECYTPTGELTEIPSYLRDSQDCRQANGGVLESVRREEKSHCSPAIPCAAAERARTILTSDHYADLIQQLMTIKKDWEIIALNLGFKANEIADIKGSLTRVIDQNYIFDVIEFWLRWAPEDGRKSKDVATLEALQEALKKANHGTIELTIGN